MEAKYKVGDKVTIKRTRNGSSSDYRFSFTDVMVRECGGESYTIKSVCKADSFSSSRVPDDGYSYSLEDVGFTWASSMFEEPSDMALDLAIEALSSYPIPKHSESIDAFIKRKKRPELDFNL